MNRAVNKPYSIDNLPPLIVGGAVFNYQYSSNPQALPIESLLKRAFDCGYNAIDTSPYYGPLEELLGEALLKLGYPRDSYYICTKAGRVKLDEFDYSRALVRQSVYRSLKRLNTDYLDLVYMHDIEFQTAQAVIDALRELQELKKEGKVRNIGVSGYPVSFLLDIALKWKEVNNGEPLDAVLSYSNGCLQNRILFDYYERFKSEAGVKKVLNGSILSMSLLRSAKTHDFHPASSELKQRVYEIASELKSNDEKNDGVELAELATKYAIAEWLIKYKESIVLGVSNVEELNLAIDVYENLQKTGLTSEDKKLIDKVQHDLGMHMNETWPSGLH